MRSIDSLLLKIGVGVFVTVNLFTCIITTKVQILVPLNVLVAVVCIGVYCYIESKYSALATELGISKNAARMLVSDYFNYYKNVERITIDEYLEKSLGPGKNGGDP